MTKKPPMTADKSRFNFGLKRRTIHEGTRRNPKGRLVLPLLILPFMLVLCILFAFRPSPFTCLRQQAAWAAAYSFRATSAVEAGDVVVWDSGTPFGVKATAIEGADTVAGVAAETAAAGADCVIRQDGGRVAVNVTGVVTKGQWLITSNAAGKAKGVTDKQAGVFARAVTDSGTPGAGQVYASVNLGFLGYGAGTDATSLRGRAISPTAPANAQVYVWNAGLSQWEPGDAAGGVSDHGALTGLGDDDHPQYGALGQDETITGNWLNTAFPWADNEVSDALTAGIFKGAGSTTDAVDLGSAEVAGTLPDANIASSIHRDSETKDGDLVSFDDADSKFAATDLDTAISELDDANASGPNATDYKVNWQQIGNVPAGFADGTDDGTASSVGADAIDTIDFLAGSLAATWTNMPSATTEFMGSIYGRTAADLTYASQYRIVCTQVDNGAAGADLNLQYSTDGITYQAADTGGAGEVDVGTSGATIRIGAWANLVSGAKTAVKLRIVGKQGDGVADPTWSAVRVQFRQPVGGIAVETIDAKGDLLVGTAPDTVGRLAVGSNGSAPMADSAAAMGITWNARAYVIAASFPASPAEGDLFYHSTYDTLFQYHNVYGWYPVINYGQTLDLYVDGASGSDAVGKGYASGSGATATIQYCIDHCVPYLYTGTITINVKAGTYTGRTNIYNKRRWLSQTTPGGSSSVGSITILGELTYSTSGTATGGTSTTLVKAGAGWPSYQYKLLRLTGGTGSGQFAWILSNTADTLTIAGSWTTTPDATTTFSIDVPATICNNTGGYVFYVSGSDAVSIKYIKVADASTAAGFFMSPGASAVACWFSSTNITSTAAVVGQWSTGTINACYFDDCNSYGFATNTFSNVTLTRSWFRSCGNYGVLLQSNSYMTVNGSYTDANATYGIIASQGSQIQFGSAKTLINNETTGVYANDNSLIGNVVANVTFAGCTANYSPVGEGNNDAYGY